MKMNTENSSVIGQRYFYSDSGRRNVDCLARRAQRFINDSPKLTIPSPNFFKANWVTVFRSFILDIYNIQARFCHFQAKFGNWRRYCEVEAGT
jgi:hypothetical protein